MKSAIKELAAKGKAAKAASRRLAYLSTKVKNKALVNVADELLAETGASLCASSIEETEQALGRAYQEYRLKGEVAWYGKNSEVNKYSHRGMAGKFAHILDHLI